MTQRVNPSGIPDAEEYYRISVYVPFLDSIIMDLNTRFDSGMFDCLSLNNLMPNKISAINDFSSFIEESMKIKVFVGVENELILKRRLEAECLLWKNQCTSITSSDIDTIASSCSKDFYPLINKLILILATLPVSVASAERSFSTLRRLKTWLRSNMTEKRLVGLTLLHVHRDISVDIEDVINTFVSDTRRLEFVLC